MFRRNISKFYENYEKQCPFCKSGYTARRKEELPKAYGMNPLTFMECNLCGFTYKVYTYNTAFDPEYDFLDIKFAALKKLTVGDSDLGINELGSHLRRRIDDVYSISPRRFEELVADVYKNLGYSVRLTSITRDGGYDLVLLEKPGGKQILVECKRYSKRRTIGVGIVRELLGVQFLTGTHRAKIVATCRFSKVATEAAQLACTVAKEKNISNFEFELVDIERLAKELEVYNTKLPPLSLEEYLKREGTNSLREKRS